jgi:hypothetical protein
MDAELFYGQLGTRRNANLECDQSLPISLESNDRF